MKNLVASLVAMGPAGVFLAALLDGAGVPFPGGVDVLLIFLGTKLPDQVYLLAGLTVLGSVTGNLFLFWLARRGGRMFLEKRSTGRRQKVFREWFDRYGLLTVFVSALVPLPVMPMKIFVLCAGALGSPPLAFLLTFIAARIPRYIGLALLGRAMGDNALQYLRDHVWHLTGLAVLLFAFLMALVKISDARRTRAAATR